MKIALICAADAELRVEYVARSLSLVTTRTDENKGEVDAAVKCGELDDMYERVDGFRRKRPRKVKPQLGVET